LNHSLVRRAAVSAVLALFAAQASACVAGKLLQPDSSFPLTSGKIFYHSYNTYGDGTGRLFQFNLRTKVKTQLDQPGWNIRDPINAFPHSDGTTIAFMGVKDGNWNVFFHRLGSASSPLNVTASLGGRNEDPKFSPDGDRLVIKHEGDIYLGTVESDGNGNLSVSSWTPLTNDGFATEESMPYFSADGEYVFYAQGARSTLRIFRVPVAGGPAEQWQQPSGGEADYYPVVRGFNNLLFTRITASGNDQIMQTSVNQPQRPATNVSMNECYANNSDAAKTSGSYIAFSSTGYNFGVYGLMLGDIASGKVWRFPVTSVNLNDGTNKLGASYSPY
jgi:Tol biopolymer transport system component